jgi:hypothetical protein
MGKFRFVVFGRPPAGAAKRYKIIPLGKPAPAETISVFSLDAATLDEAAAEVAKLAPAGGDAVAGLYEVVAQLRDPGAGPAGSFGLLAMTNPVAGREADFDAWYVGEHIPEVLAVKGFAEAERLKLRRAVKGEPQHQFLGVYGMEANDAAGAGAVMQEAGKAGMKLSDTLAPDSASFLLQAD